MAKVHYHNANRAVTELEVLKENKDGTLDLGTGKVLQVKSCPVAEAAKEGHAVRLAEEAASEPPKVDPAKDDGKKNEQKK